MKFRTVLIGTTKVGIEVPPEIVESFGAGKKPAVQVTIGSHTYRSTVAVMGGAYMVGVSAENRAAAGVAGGDEVEVTLELDTAPREVAVPEDFAEALAASPKAKDFYQTLSYSQRRWFVLGIEEAKKPETRANRIEKAVDRLASGRGQR
ncbi:YdeI/OmpD-associated family protein [Kribbella endophytica]